MLRAEPTFNLSYGRGGEIPISERISPGYVLPSFLHKATEVLPSTKFLRAKREFGYSPTRLVRSDLAAIQNKPRDRSERTARETEVDRAELAPLEGLLENSSSPRWEG